MTVDDERGRAAHTSYQVRERLNHATLVEALLHTGRTHQIRVHFQFLGHPLVGDKTYGQRQNRRLMEFTRYTAPRQMLHAAELGFVHPGTGRPLRLRAPLPEDFADALRALRAIG
jgi:23S rRNA pseudouridine1911/1915/1917 synthase